MRNENTPHRESEVGISRNADEFSCSVSKCRINPHEWLSNFANVMIPERIVPYTEQKVKIEKAPKK